MSEKKLKHDQVESAPSKIKNSSDVEQFSYLVSEGFQITGSGDTTVSFNSADKRIIITSSPGAGGGGAVTSFNGRTGGVVSTEGDYSLNLLGDVNINTPLNNDTIFYNTSTLQWENKPVLINHNDTLGIQDGSAGDYLHVTTAEKTYWNDKQNNLDIVTPEQFGAVGNGTTDDSVAIQNAIASGKAVVFGAKTYLCGDLIAYSNTNLIGTKTTLKFKSGASYLVSVNPVNGGTPSIADNQKDITFNGITFVGRVIEDGFFEQKHLLNINAASNVRILNCSFKAFQGDGIYLGSSNVAATERHNTNIVIDKCFFDGINKENRNGVSIIDCDNLVISNCDFQNITRSNMPGAIDLEPNTNAFSIVKNIKIDKNNFNNIGGNVGAICGNFPKKQEELTTPINNIVITNNSINTCAYGISFTQASDSFSNTTPPINLIVNDNSLSNILGGYPLLLRNIRGLELNNNSFIDSQTRILLGFSSDNSKVADGTISNNKIIRVGTVDGVGISIAGTVDRLNILNNTFVDCGKSDGTIGYAISFATNSSSSYINLSNNKISSPNSKTTFAIQKEATHTLTPSTNIAIYNQLIGVTGNAFLADNLLAGSNTGDNATNTTSNAYADGKVAQTITNGVTNSAPSQNQVFAALALKANTNGSNATGTWSINTNGFSGLLNGIVSADANNIPSVGATSIINSSGSTNYPSTAGVGLQVRRASGSASARGTFQLWCDNNIVEGLYFRRLNGFTTVETWTNWKKLLDTESTLETYTAGAGTIGAADTYKTAIQKLDGNISVVKPYKTYTILLTQSGTSDPTAIILENTLGGTPVCTRVGVGLYDITLTGAFVTDKTYPDITKTVSNRDFNITWLSANVVRVQTSDNSVVPFVAIDGALSKTPVEIKVYN